MPHQELVWRVTAYPAPGSGVFCGVAALSFANATKNSTSKLSQPCSWTLVPGAFPGTWVGNLGSHAALTLPAVALIDPRTSETAVSTRSAGGAPSGPLGIGVRHDPEFALPKSIHGRTTVGGYVGSRLSPKANIREHDKPTYAFPYASTRCRRKSDRHADVCHLGILATSNKGELGKAVCEKHRLRVNRTDCLFDCLSGFSSDDLLGVLLIKGHLSFWRSSAGPDDHGDVSIRGRCGEVAAYPIDVIICIHHGSMGCSH